MTPRARALIASLACMYATNSAGAAEPPPYSLPWQLRPAAAANAVRIDSSEAFFQDKTGNKGFTSATMVLGCWRVTPNLALSVRLGGVANVPPTGATGYSFLNPAVAATWVLHLPAHLRLAFALGVTLPVGTGGGDGPDAATAAANKAGILARSAMDNAMFAVNYTAVMPGVGFAWVDHGVTVQLDAGVLELIRVRGEAVDKDAARTNLITGLHVGYFIIPQLSVGAELRYQRWLSTPAAVAADPTGTIVDNLTVAVGVRGHFKAGKRVVLRPGLSYTRGLDDPMAANNYNIVQVDLPIYFN